MSLHVTVPKEHSKTLLRHPYGRPFIRSEDRYIISLPYVIFLWVRTYSSIMFKFGKNSMIGELLNLYR